MPRLRSSVCALSACLQGSIKGVQMLSKYRTSEKNFDGFPEKRKWLRFCPSCVMMQENTGGTVNGQANHRENSGQCGSGSGDGHSGHFRRGAHRRVPGKKPEKPCGGGAFPGGIPSGRIRPDSALRPFAGGYECEAAAAPRHTKGQQSG